jgi:hypothetical protein
LHRNGLSPDEQRDAKICGCLGVRRMLEPCAESVKQEREPDEWHRRDEQDGAHPLFADPEQASHVT